MYVVTFYSYKGGVGRTMALVNVAHLLADSGKRVLAVDFDLEAPGLSSYGPFRCAGDSPGLVEFVQTYLDEAAAPDVAGYIMRCETGKNPIWLMPAGRHKHPGYAANYGALNWQELYREHQGFLLFEDLRQQWEQFDGQGFDYVLIDSRTGHTDIGGICTRQLPDSVVIQFMPTDQNIEGLRPILDSIRGERAPVRRKRVRLQFCPSNLPDGDDQERILKNALDRARSQLGYKRDAAALFHNGSLELLAQPIYVESNPASRLASEYQTLHGAIIGHNLEDRDGAIMALARMREEYQVVLTGGERGPEETTIDQMRGDAAFIADRFPQDADVNWNLALLAAAMTRPEDELAALNVVVEVSGGDVSLPLLRRARAQASLDNAAGAIADLERLLTEEGPGVYEVAPAAELLRRLAPDRVRKVLIAAAANPKMAPLGRTRLIQDLLDNRESVAQMIELARNAAALAGPGQEGNAIGHLALMADGQFEEAMRVIASDRAALMSSDSMPELFNYGVCEWAVSGRAPQELFARVLAIRARLGDFSDVNGLQCFSLCNYVLDRRREAMDDLHQAQRSASRVTSPVFSCWRYLSVGSKGMLEDLDEMNDLFVRGVEIRPPTRDGFKAANLL
jgi:cellulose biosynthesis protein BcsQ